MKVKIGDKVFDGNKEPVMVILSDEDKLNIRHMRKTCMRYCSYPEGFDSDEIKEWMNDI